MGLVEKTVYFLKTVKNSKKAKHSFVGACITHYHKPVRFNNSTKSVAIFVERLFIVF